MADESILAKIRKLLAIADRSPSQHEAETALAKAQSLMEQHNIELERVREPQACREFVEEDIFRGSRRPTEGIYLGSLLRRFFFVQVMVSRPPGGQSWVFLFGTPENVAMGRYVWAFLIRTYRELWRRHKRKYGRRERDRTEFYSGLSAGLAAKLSRERESAHRSAEESNALVRVGHELSRAFEEKHPGMRTARSAASSGNAGAWLSGHTAGQQIEIHRPLSGPAAQPRLSE